MFYNIPKRFAVPMLPEHVYPVMPFFGSLPDSHDHEDHAWLREPCSRIRKVGGQPTGLHVFSPGAVGSIISPHSPYKSSVWMIHTDRLRPKQSIQCVVTPTGSTHRLPSDL